MAITIVGNKMIILELEHKNYILTAQDLPEINHFNIHPFKNMVSLIKNKFDDKQINALKKEVFTEINTVQPDAIEKDLEEKYGHQAAVLYKKTVKENNHNESVH